MRDFSPPSIDFIVWGLSYFPPMTPVTQVVLVLCAVVLTVATVVTFASIRRAATRAETVLQLVEREIRPLASQVEGLASEVRTLSQKIARVVGVANSLASFRGVTSVGSGVKRALGVFVSRLKAS